MDGLSIAALGNARLHTTVSLFTRPPYQIWRVARPCVVFSPQEQDAWIDRLIEVSSVIYATDTSLYWNDRRDYFHHLDEFWVAEKDGRLIGWCGVCVWDHASHRFLYIDTLNVVNEFRRQRLAALLMLEVWLRHAWANRRLLPLTFRTQSPTVYRLSEQLVPTGTYPALRPRGTHRDAGVARSLARFTAERTSPGCQFEEDSFIVRHAYGHALFGDKPHAIHDAAVDHYFNERMNLSAGDATIIVTFPRYDSVIRALIAYTMMRLGFTTNPARRLKRHQLPRI